MPRTPPARAGHCRQRLAVPALALGLLAACQTMPPPTPAPTPETAPATVAAPSAVPPPPTPPAAPPTTAPAGPALPLPPPAPALPASAETRYERVGWDALPALSEDDLLAAWPALRRSCAALAASNDRARLLWRAPCAAVERTPPDGTALMSFLAAHFEVWRMLAQARDGRPATDTGRITGYYEPLLIGSRRPSGRFTVPLHRPPDDLVALDFAALVPELADRRLRGRLVDTPQGRRLVPYWTRAELAGNGRLKGLELVWVDDPVEAFFLQVQGSGRIQLEGGPDHGRSIRVGFADSNGHPYVSIGRVLIERGELTIEQASMPGIAAWARANPARLPELLQQNPSYIFFRELPLGDPSAGPLGALGVALEPGYSLAADPRHVPLGAPVIIDTRHPGSGAPLRRLMLAQDTGSAIRGPLRFDFFWGFGRAAGEPAGRQRHDVRAWLLLPRGVTPDQALGRGERG